MNTPDPASGFAALGLGPALVGTVAALGYEAPTPIQAEAIPPLLAGRDVLGQAATGTGKTAAFSLPLLQRLSSDRGVDPGALVLVPTRELALQVAKACREYGRELGARIVPLYGGQPISRQLRALRDGADVIVATPGRTLDHLERGSLSLAQVEVVVLDEADEMLDMGFAEELEAILDQAPSERQTVLFSATLPPRIRDIAEAHLKDPVRIALGGRPTSGEAQLVRHIVHVVPERFKIPALLRVLDVEAPTAALVFCRTREEVDALAESLNERGYRAEALHGGLSQEQRDRVMGRVRSGVADLLVATDVAARGLDVEHLTHVVNFGVPSAPEAWVHRVGRVGRAGRTGVAITLAEPRERRLLALIERVTRRRLPAEPVPGPEVLRERRQARLQARMATLLEEDLEAWRPVLDGLDADPTTVALAALKLAWDTRFPVEDDLEIPDLSRRPEPRSRGELRDREPRGGPRQEGRWARLFVSLGREAGIRPGDLVGAIAGEAGVSSRRIGAITISDRHTVVEVDEDIAEQVIAALQHTSLRGRRPKVRRDQRGPKWRSR